MADVVAVAEVGEPNTFEAPEPLANRHRVGERLQRVGEIGEPVDHGDRCVLREDVDFLLVERANEEGTDETRQHERRVAVALAPRELKVAGGQVQRHAAELGDPDFESDARAR